MAATLAWFLSQASAATLVTPGALLKFKNANDNVDDLNDPMVRPSTGLNYSFEKALIIQITAKGSPASTSLSALKVKLSTNTIVTSGGAGNVNQAYAWTAYTSYTQPQQYSGGSGGVGGAMPTRVGVLSTTEVSWSNAKATVDLSTFTVTNPWPHTTSGNADLLYCQMEVGSGAGGTLTTYQTIAVYNEV